MTIGIEREIHFLIKEKFLCYIMIFVKNEEGLISNLRFFLFLEFLKYKMNIKMNIKISRR